MGGSSTMQLIPDKQPAGELVLNLPPLVLWAALSNRASFLFSEVHREPEVLIQVPSLWFLYRLML